MRTLTKDELEAIPWAEKYEHKGRLMVCCPNAGTIMYGIENVRQKDAKIMYQLGICSSCREAMKLSHWTID